MAVRLVVGNVGAFIEVAVVMHILLVVVWGRVAVAAGPRALVHPIRGNGIDFLLLFAALGMIPLGAFVDLAAKVENVHNLHVVDFLFCE